MKKLTLFLSLLFCMTIAQFKAQINLYDAIQVNTIPTDYTVTAVNDTTFAREVVISIIDTLEFKNLTATLDLKTDSTTWSTVQSASSLTEPNNSYTACQQVLCFYKRQPNVWVLFLGNYSLLTTHRIQLHFETLHATPVNYDWSNEF